MCLMASTAKVPPDTSIFAKIWRFDREEEAVQGKEKKMAEYVGTDTPNIPTGKERINERVYEFFLFRPEQYTRASV